jgi:hypothetical protein
MVFSRFGFSIPRERFTMVRTTFLAAPGSLGLPLEDMMEVKERTLLGCLAVTIWPIIPPMDAPTRWA